jgi:glycosyltransferase involved in cell wall biosynthesis
MRVGIDALPLVSAKTGIGHYTFELAQSLARVSPHDEFQLVAPIPIEVNDGLAPNLRSVHAPKRKLWWVAGLPLYVRRSGLQLFHGTNYEVPLWGCPTALSIHDLSLLLYPETHTDEAVRRARSRLPLMARSASCIMTGTEAVKREISEHLGVSSSKIAVTPYAPRRCFRPLAPPETEATRKRLGVENSFILFVGTIEPRKNLVTLLKAFWDLLKQEQRAQLVIAGKEGWLMDDALSAVDSEQLKDRVKFTGYVSDDELCALYSSCVAFVYPSLYEGFGLPVLEAMACGAPVITSNIASIAEVAGSAAELIPPTDVQQLAHSMAGLLRNEDKRKALSRTGLERAAEFSWERTARATLEVYRATIGRRKRGGNEVSTETR